MSAAIYDHVHGLAQTLSAEDRLRLISDLASGLNGSGERPTTPRPPRKSLWGALKDLGPAPSAEEIDEARREEWKNFPREDI